jgi:hypothetical protein
MIITHDSKLCVAICAKNQGLFELRGYDLNTFKEAWMSEFRGEFIKMNIIEQNLKGDTLAIAGQDNGHFHLRVLDQEGNTLDDLDVTEVLEIDNESKPINGQHEPLISCSFIQGDDLFVSVYHRK